MTPIVDLVVLIGVATTTAVAGYVVSLRWPSLKLPLTAIGFCLLGWTVLLKVAPERLGFLFPTFLNFDLQLAGSFVLLGVLAAKYRKTMSQRVLGDVLALMLAYFTLANPVFFAVAADEIKALDYRVVDGVTLQGTHYTCMPASLATILRQWGLEYTEGDVAYALRTSFQGTARLRVPGVVKTLGKEHGLEAKIIDSTWEELRRLNVPAILETYSGDILHASALLGLDAYGVVTGEPLIGRLEMSTSEYAKRWRWSGKAIVIAPDFLHEFAPGDKDFRAKALTEKLEGLGYAGDFQGVRNFQRQHGLSPSGMLDWRTILVLDSIDAVAGRVKISDQV